MKDLDLRLEVVSGSRQLLRYIWRWISRKPLEIEVWFQRSKGLLIENGIMAYRMVTWSMTSRDLERSNSWPQYAESAISRKWLDLETVPKDHQYEMAYRDMGYQIVTWPMTSHDPRRCCETVRSAILATAWLLVVFCFSFISRCAAGFRHNYCFRPMSLAHRAYPIACRSSAPL